MIKKRTLICLVIVCGMFWSAFIDQAFTGPDDKPATANGDKQAPPAPKDKPDKKNDRIQQRFGGFTLGVFDLESKIAQLKKLGDKHAGFVTLETKQRVEFKIPAANFDAFIEELKDVGRIATKNIGMTDLTREVTDLREKIKVREGLLKDFDEQNKSVKNTEDMSFIYQQKLAIVTEIEGYKGRLRKIMDMNTYATASIALQLEYKQTEPSRMPYRPPADWVSDCEIGRLMN